MVVKPNHASLKKLKKKVRVLQKKEERSRQELRAALKKIHKLGHSYKVKLAAKLHKMKEKIAETQLSAYARAVSDLQQQIVKSVNEKSKLLKAAIRKFEKKHKLSASLTPKKKRKPAKKKTGAIKKISARQQPRKK
jgi:hypothetical protein